MKPSSQRRAIFLDRDGVLLQPIIRDRKPYAATTPAEVQVLDGVSEACAELSRLGFLLVLITNQPDVARGKTSRRFVDETNEAIARAMGLDDIQVCDHDNFDHCSCRKPKPGLIMQAAEKLSIDLAASIVVGDRWRDIEAGKSAGCRTVFIDYNYNEEIIETPDHIASSLPAALNWIRSQV